MAETRPDPDLPVDREAIDAHARKLVAEKLRRDVARYEALRRKPLSFAEIAGILLAVAAVVAIAALALIAGR